MKRPHRAAAIAIVALFGVLAFTVSGARAEDPQPADPPVALGRHLGQLRSPATGRTAAEGPGRALSPHWPLLGDGLLVLVGERRLSIARLRDGSAAPGDGLAPGSKLGALLGDGNDTTLSGAVRCGGLLIAPFVTDPGEVEMQRGTVIKSAIARRQLVAFDPAGPSREWEHRRVLADAGDLGLVSFAAPPIADADTVYATGTLTRGFVQSWIAAFDPASGKPRWSRWLGSGQVELTLFGEQAVEPPCAPPLLADGILYHATGLGFVAAADAATGEKLLHVPYDAAERARGWRPGSPVLVPGEGDGEAATPPILVVAPLDADELLGIDASRLDASRLDAPPGADDAGDDRILWRRPRRDGAWLIGATDGRLFTAGDDTVRAVDARTGKGIWRARLDEGERIAGRGLLAGDHVVVPTDVALVRIERTTGRIVDRQPFEGHAGGHLAATAERVVVCTRDDVHIYENAAGD